MSKEYWVYVDSVKTHCWFSEKTIRQEAARILAGNGTFKSWLDIDIESAIQICNDDGRVMVTTKTRKI
jgi:hypothetical protein